MNFRIPFLLALLLPLLCAYDQSRIIYMDSLVGPFNCTIPTYGNYAFNDSKYINYITEKSNTQTLINNLFNYYNRSQFPRGPQYFLEYYRDSSLSTVAYVVYKKVNATHTFRYFAIRAQYGIRNGSVFYLGQDVCQACRPGHEMPLLTYDLIDPLANMGFTMSLLNVLNTAQRTSYSVNTITKIKRWSFPKGTFYIPIITLTNSSQLYTAILDTPDNYMSFLNQRLVPFIMGNAQIDYVYMWHYLNTITNSQYTRVSYYQNFIHFFQFYLDTTYRDTLTFMIHVQIERGYITKVMGILQKDMESISRGYSCAPYKLTVVYTMNYTSPATVPYYNSSYFNNDQYDQRMGTNATTNAEYASILSFLSSFERTNAPAPSSNMLNLSYIDYPNGKRQYTIDYKCSLDRKIYHIYWIATGPVYTSRVVVGNATFNDNSDWKGAAERIYEYAHEYEIISYYAQYTYLSIYFYYSEYCSLGDGKFQLMIFSSPAITSTSTYCLNRQIFFRDFQTDRIVYLGNASATTSNCTREGFPKQYCPMIIAQSVDVGEMQSIFNALSNKLVNSNGEVFTSSELSSSFGISTRIFGVANVYLLYFLKNEVLSVFYVFSATNGTYTVVDYVEGVNGSASTQPSSSTSLNSSSSTTSPSNSSSALPVIGSSAPQINNAVLNVSFSAINKTNSSNPFITTSSSDLIANQTSSNTTPTTSSNPAVVTIPTQPPVQLPTPSIPTPIQIPIPTPTVQLPPATPIIVSSNPQYPFTILGSSQIPASYIQADYPSLFNTIKPYISLPTVHTNPMIFSHADDEMKVVMYALAFNFVSTLYQIFEVVKIVDSNQYVYINSLYLPQLPQEYWQTGQGNASDALQQQINKVIGSNAACNNTKITSLSVKMTQIHCGGYHTINGTLSNGFTFRIGFLQIKLNWRVVYSVFTAPEPKPTIVTSAPKTTVTSVGNHSGGIIPLNTPYNFNSGVSISIDTIMADQNIKLSFQQIYPYIFKAINGFTLKQGLKGVFSGFTAYQLKYSNCGNANVVIRFVFDNHTQQVIYCAIDSNTGTNVVITPTNAGTPSPSPLSQQDIAQLIVKSSLNIHPELNNFKQVNFSASVTPSLVIFTIRYTAEDGSIYNQVVQVSVPSITIKEIGYARSLL